MHFYADAAYDASALLTGGRSKFSEPPRRVIPHPYRFGAVAEVVAWFDGERANIAATIRAALPYLPGDVIELAFSLKSLYYHYHQADDWLKVNEWCLDAAISLGNRSGQASMHESNGAAFVTL